MPFLKKDFSADRYTLSIQVDIHHDQLRLDQFLMEYFSSFSRQKIQRKIRRDEVSITTLKPGREISKLKPSTVLNNGEAVTIWTDRGELENDYWQGELIEKSYQIEVLEETESYIAVNKPPFFTTHPTGKHLFDSLTVHLDDRTPEGEILRSVHRLDRETSGINILAKTAKEAQSLTEAFENRKVKKVYVFVAKTTRETPQEFWAKERLGIKEGFIPSMTVHCFSEDSQDGKSAETYFKVLWRNENYTLGLAYPKTGRQHQIRAHASFHGLPLVGDKLYSGDPTIFCRYKDNCLSAEDYEVLEHSRHLLHAAGIHIQSRTSKAPITIFSPFSHDIEKFGNENQIPVEKISSDVLEVFLQNV